MRGRGRSSGPPRKKRSSGKAPKNYRRRKPARNVGSGLQSVIVRGARTLLSLIPSAASGNIGTLADFIFKNVGFSSKYGIVGNNRVFGDVSVTGLNGAFYLRPCMLLANVPGYRESVSTAEASVKVTTNYNEFRVLRITAVLQSTAPLGTGLGYCYFGFAPFMYADQQFSKKMRPANILAMPVSAKCRATGSCRISYTAKVSDDFFSQYHKQDVSIGYFAICFEDLNRTAYTTFTPEYYQCQVNISGEVLARGTDPAEKVELTTTTKDALKSVGMIVYAPEPTNENQIIQHLLPAECIVEPCGTNVRVVSPLQLEDYVMSG